MNDIPRVCRLLLGPVIYHSSTRKKKNLLTFNISCKTEITRSPSLDSRVVYLKAYFVSIFCKKLKKIIGFKHVFVRVPFRQCPCPLDIIENTKCEFMNNKKDNDILSHLGINRGQSSVN